MPSDPKPPPRIRNVGAVRAARLDRDACLACLRPPGSVHHIIPRGEGGDDVPGNLIVLCGSGTTGCHGAWHGNPCIIERRLPLGVKLERRDREWVARRIGEAIKTRRPDVVAYVLSKLGDEPGRAYLARTYYLEA